MKPTKIFLGVVILLLGLVLFSAKVHSLTVVANYTFYNGNGSNTTVANDTRNSWNLNVSKTVVFPYNESHAYQFANSSGASLNSTQGISNLTINVSQGGMIWFQLASAVRNQTIWMSRIDTNNRLVFHYHASSGGTKRCEIVIQTTAGAAASSNGTASCLPDGKWHSFIWDFNATINGTAAYYDGVQVSTDAQSGTSGTDGQRFGQLTDGTGNLTGAVGYSYFYTGVSTAQERTNFINAQYTGLGLPAFNGSNATNYTNVSINFSSATTGTIPGYAQAFTTYAWPSQANTYVNNSGSSIRVNTTLLLDVLDNMSTGMVRIDIDGTYLHPTASTWSTTGGGNFDNLTSLQQAVNYYVSRGYKLDFDFVYVPDYLRNRNSTCNVSSTYKTCGINSTTGYAQYVRDAIGNVTNGSAANLAAVQLVEIGNEWYGSFLLDNGNVPQRIAETLHMYNAVQPTFASYFPNVDLCIGNIFTGSANGQLWTQGVYGNLTNSTVDALCPHKYSNFDTASTLISGITTYLDNVGYGNGQNGKDIYCTECHTSNTAILGDDEENMNWYGRTANQLWNAYGTRFKAMSVFTFTDQYNTTSPSREFPELYECYNQAQPRYLGCYNGSKVWGSAVKDNAAIKNFTWGSTANATVLPTVYGTSKYAVFANENNYTLQLNVTLENSSTWTVASDLTTGTNYTFSGNSVTLNVSGYDVLGGNGGLLAVQFFIGTNDTTPPTVTVTSPTNTTYNTTSVTINFTATDAETSIDSYWYYNGATNVTYTSPVTLTLANGYYQYRFYANNTAGLIGNTNVTFTVAVVDSTVGFNITARSNTTGNYITTFNATVSYYDLSNRTYNAGGTNNPLLQETANVSVGSGTTANGNYSFPNYYMYINYTKPSLTVNATWQIKEGALAQLALPTNYTIPGACVNAYSSLIQLRIYSNSTGAESSSECYNGTGWYVVANYIESPNGCTGLGSSSTTTMYDANYSTQANFYVPTLTWKTSGQCGASIWEEGVYWVSNNSSAGDPFYTTIMGFTNTSNMTLFVNTTAANVTVMSSGYLNSSYAGYSVSSNLTANLTPLSLNITFFDEVSGSLLNGTVITFFFQGQNTGQTYNNTTNTSSNVINTIVNDIYTITYSAPGYSTRNYVYNANSSAAYLPLYLLSTGNSTVALFTVVDVLYRNAVPNSIIYLQSKNTTGTNYNTVEICTTDSNGECVMNVRLVSVTEHPVYRVLIYYLGNLAYNSGDTAFTTNTRTFAINIASAGLQDFFDIAGSAHTLTENHSTINVDFNYTFADTFSIITQECLYITSRSYSTITNLYVFCDGNDTGTIYTSVALQGIEICASGYATTADGVLHGTERVCILNDQSDTDLGAKGLFFIVLPLFLTFIMIFRARPGIAIMAAALVLFVTYYTNLLGTTSLAIGGVLILLGAIYMSNKT